MAKRKTAEQLRWQEEARGRVEHILRERFGGNQTRLARAMGVSQALVNMVVRGVQPPTRRLIELLARVEGINPLWVVAGEGEPFLPDVPGTLPISHHLLVELPTDRDSRASLLIGERFPVAPEFDRPSCYFWRLPAEHPAVAVVQWRLRAGDLILMELAREAVESAARAGQMGAVRGETIGQSEPVYGEITADAKSRLTFGDLEPRMRLPTLTPSGTGGSNPTKSYSLHSKRRRTIRRPRDSDEEKPERAADPYLALPHIDLSDLVSIQFLMVRPNAYASEGTGL